MGDNKSCTKCNSLKPLDDFKKVKNKYYLNYCKECSNASNRIWQSNNKDKIKKASNKWKLNNLDHKNNVNLKHKTKYKNDIKYKLKHNLRSRLNIAIKNNQKTGSAISDLGCSIEQLKQHLESNFQPGMTWANWSLDGWHIDHIKPLSSFNLEDKEELKKACHYTNLQPMWAKDNLSKGAK